MNKTLTLHVTFITVLLLTSNVCAQEDSVIEDDFEAKLLSIKNPFKPQIFEKEKEVIVPEIPEPEEASNTAEEKKIDVETEEDEASPPIELTDPSPEIVKPVETEEIIPPPPLPDVNVSGIIWNSDRPQAIINDRIVDIDSDVSGIKITEIRQSDIKGLFHEKAVTIKQKGVTYD